MNVHTDQSEISNDELTVIMFSSKTCSACPTALEKLKQVNAPEGVKAVKIDIEDDSSLAILYRVMSLPTFVFVRGIDPLAQLNGVQTVDAIEKTINSLL